MKGLANGWDRTKGRPEPIRALNRVRERENHEPLVDLRDACPRVIMARPSVIPYLRRTVAEKLHAASLTLPADYRLGVVDAWRPFPRQVLIFQRMWDWLEEARPGLSHAQKRRIVCRFVAPTDQKAPPGHTTGAAVDVHLLDPQTLESLDVSAPFTRLQGAPTYKFGLSQESQERRTALIEAMLGAGFSNCRDEWWHYSWGDAGWAVREGLDECVYGRIDLPESEYAVQQEEWVRAFAERENPFLDVPG